MDRVPCEGKLQKSHSEPPRRSLLGTYKRDVAMENSLHLDEDNHNPGAQNIEIIERVRLKGHQNHFILECRSFWKTIRFNSWVRIRFLAQKEPSENKNLILIFL